MPGVVNAFGPAIAFLNKQRFVVKLSIVGALFLLPLAVALGFVAAQIKAGMQSCDRELAGIACQRRLFELDEAVVRYALQVDGAPQAPPSLSTSTSARSDIDRLVNEIGDSERADDYDFIPQHDWSEVESNWQSALTLQPGTAEHRVAAIRLASSISVCAHAAANRSNMVSLPHSGASFLADTLAIQTRLVHHVGAYSLAPPESNSGASAAVAELEAASRGFATAVTGAVADNHRLAAGIRIPATSLALTVDQFSAMTAKPHNPGDQPDRIALALHTIDLSRSYYDAGSKALTQIVSANRADFVRQMRLIGVTSAASLALAVYFLIGLYLSTMSSVSELAGKARRLSLRESDDVDLTVSGRDEIALVGTQALAEIHRNLAEVKSLRLEIEQREKVEAALRSSEGRYRRMFEGNRAMQWLIDPDTGQIVDANSAACKFYGYSQDEIRKLTVGDINIAGLDVARTSLRAALQNEGLEFSFHHKLASGEIRQVEVRPTGVEVDGRELVHTIITDVTDRNKAVAARKIAEAKYEKIFENAVEGIFQSSTGGRYLSANPALARIYGYSSAAELIDSIVDIGSQLYVDQERRAELNAILDVQSSVKEFISQVYRKDGAIIWIEESVRAVRDETGKALHYEGTVQDITERMALEHERDQILQDAVERADRDPLTGFLNHRSFHKKLQDEAERAVSNETSLAIVVIDLDNFKFFNDAYGHLAGDEVLQLVAKSLIAACRPNDTIARFGGDEFALLLPDLSPDEIQAFIVRISDNVADLGYRAPGYDVAIPLTISAGTALYPNETSDRVEALEMADQRMLRSKLGDAEEEELDRIRRSMAKSLSGFSMLDALVTAVDNKDRYTRRHSEDVLIYSIEIARGLGLDDRTLHDIRVAALLHDVGKIGVPDYVLRKPGKLSDEEFEAIRQHPMMGAVIVAAVPGLEHTLDAVRHHHERWDGEGYPWGLKCEEIPLTARIMAVADAFSAMTTDRPYRKGMPKERALAILRDGAGTQWDPRCVEVFLAAHHLVTKAPEDFTRPSTPLTDAYRAKVA